MLYCETKITVKEPIPDTLKSASLQYKQKKNLSRLLKCFLIAQRELVTLGTTANRILNRQATGRERGSHPTFSPNPRTNNKQTTNKKHKHKL